MVKIIYHSGERILHIYRQAKAVLVKPFLTAAVLLYLPWSTTVRYGIAAQFRIILVLWTIGVLFYFVRQVLVWRLNHYIITDKRLIAVSHLAIFKKLVVETPIERILNVSFKTSGLWSSLMGFGDVEVQVVGLVEPIILHRIRHPARIKDYLWQLHSSHMKGPNEHAFSEETIAEIQQNLGYTKQNQKIL